jgi:hypothetical protein
LVAFANSFILETVKNEVVMLFGFCQNAQTPVRTEPDHRSEMCTQILFGELYAVLEETDDWLNIRLIYDNYTGWIDRASSCLISETEFQRMQGLPCSVSTELVQLMENRSIQSFFPVLLGSSLHGIQKNVFAAGEHEYFFEGTTESIPQDCERDKVLEMALMYLHSPYFWGGRSPFGIDCSGFTQMTYKLAGVQLLRDASQQATQGETISFISDAKDGDLLFFDDEEGLITHVGILLPEGRIIHASGKVRIDKVDHEGIFNAGTQRYSHKLRLIKKIL